MKLNITSTWSKEVTLTAESLKSVALDKGQVIVATYNVSTPDLIDRVQALENGSGDELSTKDKLCGITSIILNDLQIKTATSKESLEVDTDEGVVKGVETIEYLPIGLINDIVTGFF